MKKNLNPLAKMLLPVVFVVIFMTQLLHAQTNNTFNYTGAAQTFTVPSCVTTLTVDLRGGEGANAMDKLITNASGGLGARTRAILTVTPGQVLTLYVGGAGNTNGSGGYNGGGSGGLSTAGSGCNGGYAGGGGGASDIRLGGVALTDRIVVAAGGGGAGRDYCNGGCIPCGCGGSGGAGGGLTGINGYAANDCGYSYGGSGLNYGGGGGSASGGSGGPGDGSGLSGSAGILGTGGTGANGTLDISGGGGGGGYYGGGGGGGASNGSGTGAGGGAGGSSYANGSYCSNINYSSGFQSGNGSIVISYIPLGTAITASSSFSLNCPGTSTSISASSVLSYTWTNGPNTAAYAINPSATTIYTVHGTNSFGCISTATVEVYVHAAPVLNATVHNPLCSGSLGSATLNISGGTGPFTYTWSNGAGTNILSSLNQGVYTGTITDALGCLSTSSLSVNAAPQTLSISASAGTSTLCSGNSVTLSAIGSGGTGSLNYQWINGPATTNYIHSPSTSINYTIQITDANGCSNTQIVPLTVYTTPTISVNSGAICSGNSFSIVPSGALTYTYSGGTDIVSPMSNSSYSVTGTSANGCISANSAISHITVNITPTIGVNSGAICAGDAFTILPSGASTYTYSGGIAIVSPTGNMVYTITGTSSEGCISTNMAISNLTVHPLPIISANSGSICSGDSFTINASGALSYTYSGGSDIVNPNTTSSYSISGTSADGCISSAPAVIAITVHASPTISINNGVICSGESFTLNPSGALTYTYSSGNSVVSPMTNTSFNIIGTSAQGCISTNTAIANITVNITPTISVNSGSICSGNNFILIPSGAVSYTYSGGSATVSPMNDDSYTITGTSAEGCINNNVAVANVTVHLTPTISVNSGSICSGNSFTLIPSGALTYTFSSGNSIVNPMTDNAYNVIGTSAQGCIGSNTAISNVSVYPSPTITSISGTICSGNSFNIVASGANTYTYSGGSTLVSPMSTTAYSITGTSALGCISAAPAVCDVTVHQTPTVSVNSGSICSGDSFTIIASGASSYTYSGGTTVVNPMTNTAFNVIGISAQGCISSNTAIANVTVNITPTVSVNSGSICSGESFTMVPAGANTYTFSSGVAIVSPIVNDNYFVLGTSAQGCISSNTAVSNVTVHPTPTITAISGSICSGNSFNLNAGGAFTYSYSSGNSIVSPNSSTTYSIIGTSLMGCTSASPAISNVTVFTTPTVSANSALICEGDSYTINPSGALTYTFSSGSAVVSPSISTGYTITGSSIDNCISANVAIITVSVQPAISLSITGTPTVCIGAPVTIYAAGATSYTWNLGANSANITVVPIANTTYSVYGEYGVCHNSAAYTISVIARPIVNATISNSVICIGNSVIANASGANNYVWSGNIINGIAFSPSVSASYSVVGTSTLTGCSSSNQAVVNILVNPLPILNVSSSRNLMCVGESVSLTAGGANTYVWNTGSTNNNIVVSPTLSTTYTLTGTDINSCQNKVVYTQSVSACNGLDKLSGNGIKMNVFPNPNNGEFYIVSDQDLNIIITNELGQHILSAQLNENNQHQVQINKLSNGIYFIIGTNNHNNVKQKVIITQ